MKSSDIASLILIVAISFTVAYFLGNTFINTPESRSTEVEVVAEVGPELAEISDVIFNSDAINITEDITIEQSDTDNPFVQ